MYELLQGHWKRGQLLRQKKLFRESFSAFLEGYWKGDGTVSEKYNILVEVVASFSNITGFIFFCLGFEDRINCFIFHIWISICVHQAFGKLLLLYKIHSSFFKFMVIKCRHIFLIIKTICYQLLWKLIQLILSSVVRVKQIFVKSLFIMRKRCNHIPALQYREAGAGGKLQKSEQS